ncbi:uncharacterized protein LTR77_005487 [Saxophila tyrrhenica]|uniref:Uncharacterized protein n=1 Tax=Saxophila tyrrhenica TaxID=1690608 RepID=A0AAV9P8X0_9PEZI|nr:hypothetical protein LTR77_005487 [Saxophila tyrrhenica]
MPPTRLIRRRIDTKLLAVTPQRCCYSNGRTRRTDATGAQFKKRRLNSDRSKEASKGADDGGQEPSLFEQLFPDQQTPPDPPQQDPREVPPLPTTVEQRPASDMQKPRKTVRQDQDLPLSWQREAAEADAGKEAIKVLVLRNASKNLVEDDFRRLVPRGQHMEGWKMEQGDIIKHIPGRNWRTLERENHHYLLFSSFRSAFAYQSYATRIHRLVAQHTPRNQLSPILPPSGDIIQGLDANEAIESFTLTAPNAPMELRMLKPSLTPFVQLLVDHRGTPPLVERDDRMPYEARLTLEGPQLHGSSIRHLFMFSGRDRGLSWSGNDDPAPRITDWQPERRKMTPSAERHGFEAERWKNSPHKFELKPIEDDIGPNSEQPADGLKQRTQQKVYVVGFHTENAMQSFVRFWHKRPMEWKGLNKHFGVGEDGDLPAIAHVEALS